VLIIIDTNILLSSLSIALLSSPALLRTVISDHVVSDMHPAPDTILITPHLTIHHDPLRMSKLPTPPLRQPARFAHALCRKGPPFAFIFLSSMQKGFQ
jgi:hypothetical protein